MNNNMIEKAIKIAREYHGDQKRKYTHEPYLSHCFSVAGMVAAKGADVYVISAAILHDVIEDTDYTFTQMENNFNSIVVDLVYYVTDISKKEDGNREVRKEIDRQHNAKGSYWSKTIKLADLIDNTKSICCYDENFARIYMKEKKKLLEVLKNGNKELYDTASRMVENYFNKKEEEKCK